GFLTMALAVPRAFGASGWAFGVGYFVVNAVHTGLFRLAGGPGAAQAIRGIGSANLISALLVLGGGIAPAGPWQYACWGLALALQIATPYLVPIGGLPLSPTPLLPRPRPG